MAYTAEKVVTEVTQVDRGEYKLYEPSEAIDMEDNAITIKKLTGTYRLDRLAQEKAQYEAQIADCEARVVDINSKVAAIENTITPAVVGKG